MMHRWFLFHCAAPHLKNSLWNVWKVYETYSPAPGFVPIYIFLFCRSCCVFFMVDVLLLPWRSEHSCGFSIFSTFFVIFFYTNLHLCVGKHGLGPMEISDLPFLCYTFHLHLRTAVSDRQHKHILCGKPGDPCWGEEKKTGMQNWI